MAISIQTYHRVALEDGDETWELVRGHLRVKPPRTYSESDAVSSVAFLLAPQLDRSTLRVHINGSRPLAATDTYLVPDVAVIAAELTVSFFDDEERLAAYESPLPLVIEVWWRSTGDYDVTAKLPEYRERGDLEVWLVHPYDRTIRAWRRQPDGRYTDTLHESGAVPVASLPGVVVKLEEPFD